MANLEIHTTQNVNLDYKLVSVGERMLAFLLDAVILVLYLYIIETLTSAMSMVIEDRWTVFGFEQLLYLPAMFYSLYMHILFNGRTVGKMIMKIRVVKVDGTPLHWSNYFTRWMLRLLDIWLFVSSIGILTILFTEKRQRIGDMAANTVVISVKQRTKISHTILEEVTNQYEPSFSTVTQLTDKDARLIKEAYLTAIGSGDYKMLKMLRNKVASLLGIESKLYDRQFIDTILKDYNYYTQNM